MKTRQKTAKGSENTPKMAIFSLKNGPSQNPFSKTLFKNCFLETHSGKRFFRTRFLKLHFASSIFGGPIPIPSLVPAQELSNVFAGFAVWPPTLFLNGKNLQTRATATNTPPTSHLSKSCFSDFLREIMPSVSKRELSNVFTAFAFRLPTLFLNGKNLQTRAAAPNTPPTSHFAKSCFSNVFAEFRFGARTLFLNGKSQRIAENTPKTAIFSLKIKAKRSKKGFAKLFLAGRVCRPYFPLPIFRSLLPKMGHVYGSRVKQFFAAFRLWLPTLFLNGKNIQTPSAVPETLSRGDLSQSCFSDFLREIVPSISKRELSNFFSAFAFRPPTLFLNGKNLQTAAPSPKTPTTSHLAKSCFSNVFAEFRFGPRTLFLNGKNLQTRPSAPKTLSKADLAKSCFSDFFREIRAMSPKRKLSNVFAAFAVGLLTLTRQGQCDSNRNVNAEKGRFAKKRSKTAIFSLKMWAKSVNDDLKKQFFKTGSGKHFLKTTFQKPFFQTPNFSPHFAPLNPNP